MELSHLRYFKAVATTGGVTHAARVLHRVPSNVSVRIQQLEADLGVPLFLRDRGRMHLTAAGNVLIDYTNRLLALADQTREAVLFNATRTALRLGAMESTAAIHGSAILAASIEKYPNLSLRLAIDAPQALISRVLSGDMDAALVPAPIIDSGLALEVAFSEKLVLIGPEGHPPIASTASLRGSTLLVFESSCPHRQRFLEWFHRDGLVPHQILEVGSYHAILNCCSAGMGIALVPLRVLETYSERSKLSIHPLTKDFDSMQILLVWRKHTQQSNVWAIKALIREFGS